MMPCWGRHIGFVALGFIACSLGYGQARLHGASPKRLIPARMYTLADSTRYPKKAAPVIELHQYRSMPGNIAAPVSANTLGWGWFCFAEHQFRQRTQIPLYLRLGSVEQTNKLEGK